MRRPNALLYSGFDPMPPKPIDQDSSHYPYLGQEALSPTSTGLIVRIKGGDSAAWERFIALYLPLIRSWCKRPDGVLTRMDRQEVAQEVLTNVAKGIADFDENREGRSLRAWLRKITENAIADKLSYIKKRLPVSRLASDTGHFKFEKQMEKPFELPEQPNEKTILLQQILKIVEPEFSQRDWQIVDLFVNGEKTSSEVAEIMQMNGETVRRIKNKILVRIRQEYVAQGLEDEEPMDM